MEPLIYVHYVQQRNIKEKLNEVGNQPYVTEHVVEHSKQNPRDIKL